jgi:hypothetical protein
VHFPTGSSALLLVVRRLVLATGLTHLALPVFLLLLTVAWLAIALLLALLGITPIILIGHFTLLNPLEEGSG